MHYHVLQDFFFIKTVTCCENIYIFLKVINYSRQDDDWFWKPYEHNAIDKVTFWKKEAATRGVL